MVWHHLPVWYGSAPYIRFTRQYDFTALFHSFVWTISFFVCGGKDEVASLAVAARRSFKKAARSHQIMFSLLVVAYLFARSLKIPSASWL